MVCTWRYVWGMRWKNPDSPSHPYATEPLKTLTARAREQYSRFLTSETDREEVLKYNQQYNFNLCSKQSQELIILYQGNRSRRNNRQFLILDENPCFVLPQPWIRKVMAGNVVLQPQAKRIRTKSREFVSPKMRLKTNLHARRQYAHIQSSYVKPNYGISYAW